MDKLYGMRLSVMAQAYRGQEESPGIADMTFDGRFAMIVGAERDARRANKRARLLRQAGFPEPDANVIDVHTTTTANSTRQRLRALRLRMDTQL